MLAVGSTFTTLESPVGELLLTSDGVALTGLYPASHKALPDTARLRRDDALFSGVRDQLNAYFRGKLSEFTVALKPAGTDFQVAVWREVARVPCGVTRSSLDLAIAMGKPASSRAVGAAVGKNPIALIIPCHRVLGSSSLTGNVAGLELKRWLVEHEASMVPWRLAPGERSVAGSMA